MPRSSRSGAPFSSAKQTRSAPKTSSKQGRSRSGDGLLNPVNESDKVTKSARSSVRSAKRIVPNEQDLDGLNVYDYMPAPVKNARTASSRFELSREEAQLAGNKRRTGVKLDDDSDNGGSGEDDDMAGRIRRVALTIAGDDPLELDDEDDEEIDSDDAWNSGSDEERWGSSFASWKKTTRKVPTRPAPDKMESPEDLNVDLNETSDDEVSMGNDATAFDEEVASESDDMVSEPELPSDVEVDGEEELAAGPYASNGLADFVSSLPSTKRKVELSDEEEPTTAKDPSVKRRRVLPSQQGPGGREDAGEFGVGSASKLSLMSLIGSDPSMKSTIEGLLSKSDVKEGTSTLKNGKLSAPLPTVVLDRLAREAAYEQTSQEGAKWGAVMKRIKEADQLKFPLQLGGTAGQGSSKDRQRGGVKSGGDLMGDFQATNALESAVTRLLESANLKDNQIAQAEKDALEGQDVSVEEIAARRAELRRQRELLFREESRRKRVAKIKSKTYRKLARKRADKAEGEIDLDDLRVLDPKRAEEEQEKMETARARERATLKHSAKGGRWAQGQHGAGEIEGKRQELEHMLAQGERLRRKVQGHASDGSGSESGSEEELDDDEDVRARAFDELASLRAKQAELDDAVANSKPSGIFAMKFMQNAARREKVSVDEDERELRKQLEEYEDAGIESGSESGESDSGNVTRVGGRLVLSGTGMSSQQPLSEVAQQVNPNGQTKEVGQSIPQISRKMDSGVAGSASVDNPWAIPSDQASSSLTRKKNAILVGKSTSAKDRALDALNKRKSSKSAAGKQLAADDSVVDIETSDLGTVPTKTNLPLDDDNEVDETDAERSTAQRGPRAFDQRDLVAQAFAGDNVIEDFAAEKKRATEMDAPKEQDMTLAGWGSWGGKGVKKHKNARKFVKKIAGIDASERKDAGKKNVIISEKKAKAEKYLSTSLPFPYTSQSQYEQALSSNTIAPETSSMGSFQRAITPRVIKKSGAILQPLRKLHTASS